MAIYRRKPATRRFAKSRKAIGSKRSRSYAKGGGPIRVGQVPQVGRTEWGFPDRIKTRLKYCDVIQLTGAGGTAARHQFRMSSCFDPDFSGIGHQPHWFDTYATVYQTYRVLGSKITVTFSPNNISDSEVNDRGPYIVGLTGNENSIWNSNTLIDVMEDPSSQHVVLGDKQGANNVKTLVATYIPMRDLDTDSNDDLVRALTNNNPIRNFFMNVWAMDMTESAIVDVVAKIEIDFIVQFATLRTNVQS